MKKCLQFTWIWIKLFPFSSRTLSSFHRVIEMTCRGKILITFDDSLTREIVNSWNCTRQEATKGEHEVATNEFSLQFSYIITFCMVQLMIECCSWCRWTLELQRDAANIPDNRTHHRRARLIGAGPVRLTNWFRPCVLSSSHTSTSNIRREKSAIYFHLQKGDLSSRPMAVRMKSE